MSKQETQTKTTETKTEFKPYQINSEALLSEVLAKHPFGVIGAVKEHIDNAIDAGSTEVDISYNNKTKKIYIGNKSEKCYREADIEQLFHRRHHGRISQNDYGRTILFGFADPQEITIETYLCDGKKVLDTYVLSPKGWKLAKVETLKETPEFTTVVSAILKKDVDLDIDEFGIFVNTVYNLHLYKKSVKISINGKQLSPILPKGQPKETSFEFAKHKFSSLMWQKPQWDNKIYQSLTTKGVGDGAYVTSKNTLVTYAPFYRSHSGDEYSYFCLINDEEGYIAEDSLDLGKMQLIFNPKVSRFYRYIKDHILPKEKTKPSDVITEGNQYLHDFFSVGIGSYEHKPTEKTEEKTTTEPETKDEDKGKKEKNPETVSTGHRDTGLPELTLRTIKEFTTTPFVDIVNPKLLALNDADPLFDKSWMKNEMREVYLIRLIPFLDARRNYQPEQVSEARKQWMIEDQFMRKLLKAKPKKEEIEAPKGRAKAKKVTETVITQPSETTKTEEYEGLYDQLFKLDEQLKNNEISAEVYDEKAATIRNRIQELRKIREATAAPQAPIKSRGRPPKPKTPEQQANEINEARSKLDKIIAGMKPIKTWELPTRMDKETGKQKIITMGLFKVNGKNVRRPVDMKEVSGEDIEKNITKPSKKGRQEKAITA